MLKKSAISVLVLLLFLSGCGKVRKRTLLSKLSSGVTKSEVECKMGKPDEIYPSVKDENENVIDIWVYKLAVSNDGKYAKKVALQTCGWLLFWPLLFVPGAWSSTYDYECYFVKFVNNILYEWGSRSAIGSFTSKN